MQTATPSAFSMQLRPGGQTWEVQSKRQLGARPMLSPDWHE